MNNLRVHIVVILMMLGACRPLDELRTSGAGGVSAWLIYPKSGARGYVYTVSESLGMLAILDWLETTEPRCITDTQRALMPHFYLILTQRSTYHKIMLYQEPYKEYPITSTEFGTLTNIFIRYGNLVTNVNPQRIYALTNCITEVPQLRRAIAAIRAQLNYHMEETGSMHTRSCRSNQASSDGYFFIHTLLQSDNTNQNIGR